METGNETSVHELNMKFGKLGPKFCPHICEHKFVSNEKLHLQYLGIHFKGIPSKTQHTTHDIGKTFPGISQSELMIL